MEEILTVLAVVAAVGVAVFFLHRYLDKIAWQIEQGLNLTANALILFVMFFVVAEVVLRTMFNAPIPGHLEIAELIAPGIIFLALAYTQSTGGHVSMTLVVDLLPSGARRYADVFNLVLSVAIYAILTYFSAKHTYITALFGDVTMNYYYPVWPSTMAVTIGLFFSTLRLYLDLLQALFPNRIKRTTLDTHTHPESEKGAAT